MTLTSCGCCVEREYFASEDDEDLLVKQLRYYTRFITVCLLLGKRDEVWEHLQKLTELVEEFSKEAQVGASLDAVNLARAKVQSPCKPCLIDILQLHQA